MEGGTGRGFSLELRVVVRVVVASVLEVGDEGVRVGADDPPGDGPALPEDVPRPLGQALAAWFAAAAEVVGLERLGKSQESDLQIEARVVDGAEVEVEDGLETILPGQPSLDRRRGIRLDLGEREEHLARV